MNAFILFVMALVIFIIFQKVKVPSNRDYLYHPNWSLFWALIIVLGLWGPLFIMIGILVRVVLVGLW
jgi:hypothetical protein